MSRYTMRAEYPLAGADDGLPVLLTFNHVRGAPARLWGDAPDPGWPDEVDLHAVEPADGLTVPTIIQQAIWCWACDYLETDAGRDAALSEIEETAA
ncbi:MAG: hypothetical protein U1E23_09375 [Reyranellaceae bacterium]